MWIRYVFLSKRDVTLLAFRGSFKTTAISVIGSIWKLLYYPNNRILIASSTHDNAKKILQEIKSNYKKPSLIKLYSLMGIHEPRDLEWWTKESVKLITKKKTTKEGNIEAVGALSVITSRHYDNIICDDLVVLKDRISKAVRESKIDWVKELQSIIDPGGTIGYVGTSWHPRDVYSITPAPVIRPVGSVFNPKLTQERLKEIRRVQGEVFYASQYELKHIADEDRIIDDPNFGIYKPADENETIKVIAYLDPAFGGADHSALTLGFVKAGILYVMFGKIWRSQIDITYDKVENYAKRKKVMTTWVESNSAQRLIAVELRKRGMRIREVNNVKNKHLRIMDNVRKLWGRIIFHPDIDDEYMRQILDYTEDSDHDDAIDSLAGLVKATIGKRGFNFIKIGANGRIQESPGNKNS